jgi:hypothetical protein
VAGLRREANAKGLDKMPPREIDAAVAEARRAGKAADKRRIK